MTLLLKLYICFCCFL